jgi:hypothetical protein
MEQAAVKDYYDEIDSPAINDAVVVKDVGRFIEAMLRYFTGKGTLYISSYDFGYWAGTLAGFRSGEKIRLKTSLPDPAFLENGYSITDEFIYVFSIDCLKNIDPRSTFNQFLIYDKGAPLVQCCSNFDDVFVNTAMPRSFIMSLIEDGVVESW